MASGRLIDYLGYGTLAERPASPDLYTGTLGGWYSTDTGLFSVWIGSGWIDIAGDGAIIGFMPTGGWSDGALLRYDADLDAFVEIPPGTPGQVLTMESGEVSSWQDAAAGGVSSVNGQTGAVDLALEDLSDVLVGTGAPDVGDVLTWAGDSWTAEPAGGGSVDSVNGQTGVVSLSLEDLDDVLVGTGTPDAGDVLTWDGDEWVASPPPGAGSVSSVNGQTGDVELALEDLIDVLTNTGTPEVGDVLTYSADGWVATPPSAGAGSKTYGEFTPMTSQPPAASFATLDTRNSFAVADFDAGADEALFWTAMMPEGASLGSGLIANIKWAATSATSGNAVLGVSFMRMNTDIDADSYDTEATVTTACDGTSGVPVTSSITNAAIDGITAGDLYAIRVRRLGTNGSDTMTGDLELIGVELRSAA
jgi:hypothetical protein